MNDVLSYFKKYIKAIKRIIMNKIILQKFIHYTQETAR